MFPSEGDRYVYLDYAATAPLCEEAALAMAPYLESGAGSISMGGNANSLHGAGRAAFEQLERHRRSVARLLGCRRPDEIVFTSGATESDNAALFGLLFGELERRRRRGRVVSEPHLIVSSLEHEAVLSPAQALMRMGYRVTRLTPSRQGFVAPADLEAAIDDSTVLVSVQMANSEFGSVQPVSQLADIAHRHGALFHTDAVQALGRIPIDLDVLGVDAASFSGHKVGGPKGVGALYVRARTPFSACMLGGGQEAGRRSGTQNVCGIAGFEAACRTSLVHLESEARRLLMLRDMLYERLCSHDGVVRTVGGEGSVGEYLPHIVHVMVRDQESETLILRLDAMGFAVSGGSACSSHSLEPSRALMALGVDPRLAQGALRISMGRYTAERDVEEFARAFGVCLQRLRSG